MLRKTDTRNLILAEHYKKANVYRKMFSNIYSDVNCRPRKTTTLVFEFFEELKIYLWQPNLHYCQVTDLTLKFIISGNCKLVQINEFYLFLIIDY